MEPAEPDTTWSTHRVTGMRGFQQFRIRDDNHTVEIKVHTGVCIIDEADWPVIRKHKWRACSGGADTRIDKKFVLMHTLLLGVRAGTHIQHINNNKLDNRRVNLRLRSEKAESEQPTETAPAATERWITHRVEDNVQFYRIRADHTVEIQLDGSVCIFDEEDWPVIQKYKWYASRGSAVAYIKGKFVTMHALLFTFKGMKIEHFNDNKLDNRVVNVRMRDSGKAAHTKRKAEVSPYAELFSNTEGGEDEDTSV